MTEGTGNGEPPTSGGLAHLGHVAYRPIARHGRRIAGAPSRWDILAMPSTPQPLVASCTFMYVETDVPEGMSLDSWRRRGNATRSRPSLLARVWRAVSG